MNKKILLLGDSCKDIYHFGTCDRLSQEAPVPIFQESRTETKGGMSANVKNNLESFGISVKHATNENTIEKHRFFDTKFNAHVLRFDKGKVETSFVFDRLKETGYNFDAIVISDYDKGFLTSFHIKTLCEIFKDTPIFADSKKKDLSCFKDCFLKINEKEYRESNGIGRNVELIVTLGEKGAEYNGCIFSTKSREVFDVCGAGDVFLSALVYGVLDSGSIEKSIDLANKAATLSVSKAQTYVLSDKDIKEIKK